MWAILAAFDVLNLSGSGLRVPGSGFRVPDSGFRVAGSGFRDPGFGIRFRVPSFGMSVRARNLARPVLRDGLVEVQQLFVRVMI